MGASLPAGRGGGYLLWRCPGLTPCGQGVAQRLGWSWCPGVGGRLRPAPGLRFLLQVRACRGVTLPVSRGSSREAMGRGGAAGGGNGNRTPRPQGLGWSMGVQGQRVWWVLQSQMGCSTAHWRCAPLLPAWAISKAPLPAAPAPLPPESSESSLPALEISKDPSLRWPRPLTSEARAHAGVRG